MKDPSRFFFIAAVCATCGKRLTFPGRCVPCYIDELQALICVQVVVEIHLGGEEIQEIKEDKDYMSILSNYSSYG